MQTSGIITLLTDFGQRDAFVGTMKGVILGICPAAKIVDVTHGIPRQNLSAAAFNLKNSYKFFPEGTIHVVVVDPGVGSQRRIVGVQADGHYFVAPDNGVLKYIFAEGTVSEVISITNENYFLKPVSQTFHGRDIFSPVAAHLAKGVGLEKFGADIDDYEHGRVPEVRRSGHWLKGEVVYVDHFGNLVSNLAAAEVRSKSDRPVSVRIGDVVITGLVDSYARGEKDEPIALIGSSGYVEIAINLADASKRLDCTEGDEIMVTFK